MKNLNLILPTEIISDILTRLPAESVLECKSVCKTWKNLIHHVSFPQMHLARLNHPDSTDSGKLRYVFLHPDDDEEYFDDIKHLYYFEYNENEDWNYATPKPRKVMLKTRLEAYIVIGSFNGLICIYGTQPSLPEARGPAIIINPVTKESVVLPEFDSFPEYDETEGSKPIRYYHEACGFGYLAETNEYKVVRIYTLSWRDPDFAEVEVYTLGSGNGWRHVGRFCLGFEFRTHCEQTHGVFLNECLHWRNNEGGMVVVFDLADEEFRDHIPPPPMLTDTDDYDSNILVLGVSGGILYYAVYQSFEGRIFDDVWLLMNKDDNNHVAKEQEEHQYWNWIKVISLEQEEPFAFLEGGTVLRYDQGNIKYFKKSTSTWENLVNFSAISRQVFPHKHTLVSLIELEEEDAEIMKSRGVEETGSSESGSD